MTSYKLQAGTCTGITPAIKFKEWFIFSSSPTQCHYDGKQSSTHSLLAKFLAFSRPSIGKLASILWRSHRVVFGYFSDVSDNLYVTFFEERRFLPLSLNYFIFFLLIKSN